MNRSEASQLVGKLREVRIDRGATPNEAAVAQQKAAQLVERYGLNTAPAPSLSAQRRPAFQSASAYPTTGSFWAAPRSGKTKFDWVFDVNTGEHSDNVDVVYYNNRGNWKIEVNQ